MNKKKFLFLSAALAAAACMTSCIDNDEPDGVRALRESLGEKYKQEGQAAVISANAALALAQKQGEAQAALAQAEATMAQAALVSAQAAQAQAQAQAEVDRLKAESEIKIAEAESAASIALAAANAAADAENNAALTAAKVERIKAAAAVAAAEAAEKQAAADKAQVEVLEATAKLERTIEKVQTAIAKEKLAQQVAADNLASQVAMGQKAVYEAQAQMVASEEKFKEAEKQAEFDLKEFEVSLDSMYNQLDINQKQNIVRYARDLKNKVNTAYGTYNTAMEKYIKAQADYYISLNKYAKLAIKGDDEEVSYTLSDGTKAKVEGASGVLDEYFKQQKAIMDLERKQAAYETALSIATETAEQLAQGATDAAAYEALLNEVNKQLKEQSEKAETAGFKSGTAIQNKENQKLTYYFCSLENPDMDKVKGYLDKNDASKLYLGSEMLSTEKTNLKFTDKDFAFKIEFDNYIATGIDADATVAAREEAIQKYMEAVAANAEHPLFVNAKAYADNKAKIAEEEASITKFTNNYYVGKDYWAKWKGLYEWFDKDNDILSKIVLKDKDNIKYLKAAIDASDNDLEMSDAGVIKTTAYPANNHMVVYSINPAVKAFKGSFDTEDDFKNHIPQSGAEFSGVTRDDASATITDEHIGKQSEENGSYRHHFHVAQGDTVYAKYARVDYYFVNNAPYKISPADYQFDYAVAGASDPGYFMTSSKSDNPLIWLASELQRQRNYFADEKIDGFKYDEWVDKSNEFQRALTFLGFEIKDGKADASTVVTIDDKSDKTHYFMIAQVLNGQTLISISKEQLEDYNNKVTDAANKVKDVDAPTAAELVRVNDGTGLPAGTPKADYKVTYDQLDNWFNVKSGASEKEVLAGETYFPKFYTSYSSTAINKKSTVAASETLYEKAATQGKFITDYDQALASLKAGVTSAQAEHKKLREELKTVINGLTEAACQMKQTVWDVTIPAAIQEASRSYSAVEKAFVALNNEVNNLEGVKNFEQMKDEVTLVTATKEVLAAKQSIYMGLINKIMAADKEYAAALGSNDFGYDASKGKWVYTTSGLDEVKKGDKKFSSDIDRKTTNNKKEYFDTVEEYLAAVVLDATLQAAKDVEKYTVALAKVAADIEVEKAFLELIDPDSEDALTPDYEYQIKALIALNENKLEKAKIDLSIAEQEYNLAVETYNSVIFNNAVESAGQE